MMTATDDGTRRNPIALVLLVVALGVAAAKLGVNAPLVILGIGLSIFLHELGHFVTARKTGMKATEFFIGIGPKLWSFRRGETEYGLKLVPAVAYVRIIGMNNLEEVEPSDEPRAFRQQSYPRRLLVLSAGSLMHFLFAIVILMVVFTAIGVPDHKDWYIRDLDPTGAAAAAGLVEGDRIIAIGDTPLRSLDDVSPTVAGLADRDVVLTVLRQGNTIELPMRVGWRLTQSGESGIDGLLYNERVLAVDGVPVTTYADFLSRVEEGKTYQVHAYGTQGNAVGEFDVTVTVNRLDRTSGSKGYLGVGLGANESTIGPVDAVGRTFSQFGRLASLSVKGVVGFFSPDGLSRTFTDKITPTSNATQTAPTSDAERIKVNDADKKRAISIIGLTRAGKQTADSSGFVGLLSFLAFLNIAIGVFNLMPLLPLDGGHIAVATYERIRSRKGRPYHADFAKLLPLTYAVVALLLGIFVMTGLRDIFNPVNVPR